MVTANRTVDDVIKELDVLVGDDLKVITYKWLAREYGVSCNQAKRVLYKYFEQRGAGISTAFLLSGTSKKTGSHVVIVADKEKMSALREDLDPVTSLHIYSVGPKHVMDPVDLWQRHYDQTQGLYQSLLASGISEPNQALTKNTCSAVRFECQVDTSTANGTAAPKGKGLSDKVQDVQALQSTVHATVPEPIEKLPHPPQQTKPQVSKADHPLEPHHKQLHSDGVEAPNVKKDEDTVEAMEEEEEEGLQVKRSNKRGHRRMVEEEEEEKKEEAPAKKSTTAKRASAGGEAKGSKRGRGSRPDTKAGVVKANDGDGEKAGLGVTEGRGATPVEPPAPQEAAVEPTRGDNLQQIQGPPAQRKVLRTRFDPKTGEEITEEVLEDVQEGATPPNVVAAPPVKPPAADVHDPPGKGNAPKGKLSSGKATGKGQPGKGQAKIMSFFGKK